MDESALTTLLEHVLERLTNIEVKQDENREKMNKIENDIKIEADARKGNEIWQMIQNYKGKKKYDLLEIYIKYDMDYFFAIGQVLTYKYEKYIKYDDVHFLEKCIAYIFMKTMKTNWKQIDSLIVDGYNSIKKINKKIETSYEIWNFEEMDREAYDESLENEFEPGFVEYDKDKYDYPSEDMVEKMIAYWRSMSREEFHSI